MILKYKKTLFFFFLFTGIFQLSALGQEKKETTEQLEDDPIIAALDSLYKLDLFENGYQKVQYKDHSAYNFAPDSIPRYSDSIYALRLKKLDAKSPFNLKYNNVVRGYIEMYAVRKRNIVSRMMALSQLYFPMFEEALDRHNLPIELKYLAICESALNPIARSRAGAAGLWQFMYPTGKMYGLKVNSYIDERHDPIKSTEAACQYFEYLYGLYNDWEMVLAAYNCGPGNVNRAIRRSGGKKSYWEIRQYLPRETQGYVPAFIAVNYVMNYTAEHNIASATPRQYFSQVDTITVKEQISFYTLSQMLDMKEEEILFLNPSYKMRVIPVYNGFNSVLTLPSDKMGIFISNEKTIYNQYKTSSPPEPAAIKESPSEAPQPSGSSLKIYSIRSGDNLGSIANKFGCSVNDIKRWNNMSSNKIYVGKKLKIYIKSSTSASAKTSATKPTSSQAVSKADGFKYYTIKKGDSLYKIAAAFNTTVEELKRLNNLGSKYNLLPGQVIKIGTN